MSINDRRKNLTVYLAAPRDVSIEQAKVKQIIEDLNREGSLTESLNVQFVVSNWLEIGSSREINEWDIFIGILWLDPDVYPEDAPVGVDLQRKIKNAYRKWKQQRMSHFLLYRCMRIPGNPLEIDQEKLGKIETMFFYADPPGLSSMLRHPLADPVGIRRVYCDTEEFGHYLLNDLTGILHEYGRESSDSSPALRRTDGAGAGADIGWLPGDSLVMDLSEDQPVVMSVLSVDIENCKSLAKYLTYNQLNLLKKRFREFVTRIVSSYQGDQIKRTESGGIYGFWQENRFNQAVLAAARLFQELPRFDTRKIFNSSIEPLKITIAGSDGLTTLKRSEESLFFYNLNSIFYAKDSASGGSRFFINEALYKRVDDNLKADFSYNKRISGEPVYLWLRGQQDSHPSLLNLGKFFRDIVSKKTYLETILNQTFSKMDRRMLETLSVNLDVIYSGLEQFYDWFSRQPADADKEYSLQLTDYLQRLKAFEDTLWRQLRRRFNQVNINANEHRHFIELLRAINSRRTRLVVRIDTLVLAQTEAETAARQTSPLAKPARHPATNAHGSGFKELLTKFIISDELDSLDALSEVFFRYRGELIRLLSGEHSGLGEKSHQQLLKRFWKYAHIVLIEDYHYSAHTGDAAAGPGVFQSLSLSAQLPNAQGRGGSGFIRIQQLIQQPKEQVLAYLEELPPTYDTQATTNHSRVIYNCMLVAYPDKDVRRYVAGKMSLSDLWNVIIHEKIPIPILSIVAQNIGDSEDEDYVKIFFDCIRTRLLSELDSSTDRQTLTDIRMMIMIFLGHDFFVETGYFERLDDLIRKFTKRSELLGIKSSMFNEAIRFLEKKRIDKGTPNTRLPDQVRTLPLPVQRQLAGEFAYLNHFVSHPDFRIAQETLRYISAENVEQILYPEINKELMTRLLNREDLFLRQAAVMTVLLHPNCDINFATPHLLRWQNNEDDRRRIVQISRDPGTNPSVKEYARQLLSRPSSMH